MVIPFNDIQLFQQFQAYPNALFGDLELRFKFSTKGLVSIQCDPYECVKQYIKDENSDIGGMTSINNPLALSDSHVTREFVAVGDEYEAITHAGYNNSSVVLNYNTCRIKVRAAAVTSCTATIVGYRANPDALERMRRKFETEPWVKFAQNVHYNPFTQYPSRDGVQMTQQVYFNNTTDLILLFPTTENEAGGTVSKNPMLADLSLNIMNRRYPEQGIDTDSPEFVQMMLNSANTFGQPPLETFARSITEPRWLDDRCKKRSWDLTSFIWAVKCERPSAMGLLCDGLDSKGQAVPVRLQGKRKYDIDYDRYCGGLGEDNDVDQRTPITVSPILVTVNDSYFIFNSKNGGEFLYSTHPFNETVQTFMGGL